MNTLALAIYLYAGSVFGLFLWFDLYRSLGHRPAAHRLLFCVLMTLSWPVWGMLAVGRSYDNARRASRRIGQ